MSTRQALTVFAVVALLSGCANRGGAEKGTVSLTGQVLTAPTCPVQRVGQTCLPRPVSGAEVVAVIGSQIRGTTRTDGNGNFLLGLPEGHYLIKATNVGGYASTASGRVTIAGVPMHIVLTVDSGIR